MALDQLGQRTLEALMRSNVYAGEESAGRDTPGLTIAISRQAGSRGSIIARRVGELLGWNVFDKELLQQIAEQTGVRLHLLESMDEKRSNWLRECVEAFLATSPTNDTIYLHRLTETMASLAAHGNCVIVGRGAAQLLPPETTLRVRIVADRADRVTHIAQEKGMSREEAGRWVDQADRERLGFVREHFNKDPQDPVAHDLVLNSSRFGLDEAAAVIVEAAERMQVALPVSA